MTALAKIFSEETVQRLVEASCAGGKHSDERAAAINRETLVAKSKHPKLFRPEALPSPEQMYDMLVGKIKYSGYLK